jgi:hypothetical protein
MNHPVIPALPAPTGHPLWPQKGQAENKAYSPEKVIHEAKKRNNHVDILPFFSAVGALETISVFISKPAPDHQRAYRPAQSQQTI